MFQQDMVSQLEKALRIEKQVTKENKALFEKKVKEREETNKKQTLEACKNTTNRPGAEVKKKQSTVTKETQVAKTKNKKDNNKQNQHNNETGNDEILECKRKEGHWHVKVKQTDSDSEKWLPIWEAWMEYEEAMNCYKKKNKKRENSGTGTRKTI